MCSLIKRLVRAGRRAAVGTAPKQTRVHRTADGTLSQSPPETSADRSAAARQLPEITVEQAMAELDAMIGLDAVKEQIRQITASVEAARRRALAGYGTEKPMQHFVFLGPPGTGKTSVARIVAKIFYAFGGDIQRFVSQELSLHPRWETLLVGEGIDIAARIENDIGSRAQGVFLW